jgi:hypothetical protein
MAEQTRDLYAVARGTEVLTDRRPSVASTKHDLKFIEDSMRAVGLEPDVRVVQITETTTYSDPVPYTAPAPVTVVDEPVAERVEQAPAETDEHDGADLDEEDDDLDGLR